MNAFESYIKDMTVQDLAGLKAHLFAYRDALKTQPATAARNVKIREAETQISKINAKLPVAKNVSRPGSSVLSQKQVAESNVSSGMLETRKIQCKGRGWAQRICNPGEDAQCTKMLPIERNQCTCCPPDKAIHGDGQSFDQGTVRPVSVESPGPTVSSVQEGVRAELQVPTLDLYSIYADRGYAQEAASIKEETQRILNDINQRLAYQSSVPQASPVAPVTSQPVGQQMVVATETDYTLQPMPTMPSPVESISLEEATTGRVAGPVAMSAGAANVPQKVNWWLIGGLGVVALMVFGQGASSKKGKK
jgi:hypothetical protein